MRLLLPVFKAKWHTRISLIRHCQHNATSIVLFMRISSGSPSHSFPMFGCIRGNAGGISVCMRARVTV